jgi:hypothetical protein
MQEYRVLVLAPFTILLECNFHIWLKCVATNVGMSCSNGDFFIFLFFLVNKDPCATPIWKQLLWSLWNSSLGILASGLYGPIPHKSSYIFIVQCLLRNRQPSIQSLDPHFLGWKGSLSLSLALWLKWAFCHVPNQHRKPIIERIISNDHRSCYNVQELKPSHE